MSDKIESGGDNSAPPAKPLPEKPDARPQGPPRLIVPAVLVAGYWIAFAALMLFDMSSFKRFMWQTLALTLMTGPYTVWWLVFYRMLGIWQRLAVFGAMIAIGAAAIFARHGSVLWPVPILLTLPWLFTLGTLWLLATRAAGANVQMYGLFMLAAIGWTPSTMIRMEGMSGEGEAALRLRWSLSNEDIYLAEQARNAKAKPVKLDTPLELAKGDWPGFRGADRDGVLRGVKITTDWNVSPPKELWRQRIGPGWSSFAVVGGRLFTQEQRGDTEAVVAYDAETGREIWEHKDATRFEESMGGPGPRATPTFVDGKLYTLGANGTLNCLDAEPGVAENKKPIWTRDITKDADAKVPMWAFSSSPLVVDGLVYVFAGSAESDKNLLAYDAETGEPAWTAKAGTHSYSSPQLATIAGRKQIVFVSDQAVSGFDPATGKVLWSHKAANPNGYSSIQANFVTPSQFAFSFGMDAGVTMLDVSLAGDDAWKVDEKWHSGAMNPFFNDFVIYDGALYGFDNDIFCCLDAETGKRNWKGGRYDTGQVLLLADQPLLLVTGEWGDVILVAADPKKHRELGRFKAFDGKTWNHPVVVGDRLYLRNAEEMACYELKLAEP